MNDRTKDQRCYWTEDPDGQWETSCGNTFVIIDGSPADNDMTYCCYCGKKLAQQSFQEPDEDELSSDSQGVPGAI